ncbi:hypothetical protein G6O69_17295 [Pseudenhygromyxa sp. WMMC2535]|uniref:hypothetical protein n=1 Tax=Pseudenhygromyxa sp. WMMC2535 TaxID=2712867 RepID=UPI001557974E|nr:hypothetical protein [Pseudenhygromyxa sp. WMMC2535]NVB39601.1 hypothetical protein [Pseudenhygromyxa sp. WMMC2535]
MTDPASPDDALDEFQAARRRQRWTRLAVTAAAFVLAAGLFAWWRLTGLPPLDADKVEEVSKALDDLDHLPREYHALIAAEAMTELEAARLPPAMTEAFASLKMVPPERISAVALQPFADDPESLAAWSVACPAGPAAIAAAGESGDVDALFADCKLGRWSLIDGTAARRLSVGRLVLAHAAWGWLVDHHSETELERRILRIFLQG